MTKTISWGDGSGQSITLTYDSAHGDMQVQVSSPINNTPNERTKEITFTALVNGVGMVTRTLIVKQKGEEIIWVDKSITLYPAAFVSGNYSSISNQNNPIGKGSSSTSYVNAYLKTGSRASSDLIYSFDTSSIPADAVIKSVSCSAKAYISNTQSSRIATRTIQLYSGTTAKGTASTISTSTTAFNMVCGTWTRSELTNCRIKLTAKRGTSGTTTNYYMRFYGATLTIEYSVKAG